MRRFEQTTQRNTASRPLNITTTTRPLGSSPTRRRVKLVPLLVVGIALLISVVIVLLSTGMGLALPAWPFGGGSHAAAVAPVSKTAGQIFFLSSGQLNETGSQGIADEAQVNLTNLANPAAGNAYYAWLEDDTAVEGQAVMLGRLTVSHGAAHLLYTGDANHTNLLGFADRFLVTEEDASAPPSVPSPDKSTWRYTAIFPKTPDPLDTTHHFGLYDHLRHLLASDPTLKSLGLQGGLDIWLFRDTQKILEWAGSARDDWSLKGSGLMHRQFIRILDYLDGLNFVQRDLPVGTPVMVDPQIARVGLLNFDPSQEPPGYLYHIGIHLHGVVQSPGASAQQQTLATQIDVSLNKVQSLMEQIHNEAVQLYKMSDAQLLQPPALSLLDAVVKQAQDAFLGQFDPTTGEIQNGVTQIHYAVQRLATLDVNPIHS